MQKINTPKAKFNKAFFLILLMAFLIVVFCLIRFFYGGVNATQYITTIANRGDIEVSVLAEGVVKPQNLVAIGAQTSGKIVELKVSPGDKVLKNQVIARIDSINQENDLKKAEHALAVYKAKLDEQKVQLELSNAKLKRSNKLLESNAIMLSSYKENEAQVAINKAEIEALKSEISQAQIDVQTAKLALSYTQIKAPDDGTILATLVQEGQNINAVQSVPIVAILGNLQRMKIYAQISEADISKIRVGQEVYFNVVGNTNKIYHAHLETIDPAPESIRDDINFDSSSRTGSASAIYYNATFTVDNEDRALLTYMTCEVHIILGKASNVVLVPSSALQNIRDDVGQIVIKHGTIIEHRDVKIGLNNKVMAEIKDGVSPGEEIVLSSNNATNVTVKEEPKLRHPRHMGM